MKLRIWGTKEECAAMVGVIMASVPNRYIKSISGWYQNNRRGEFSTEGRVYCDFRDIPESDLKNAFHPIRERDEMIPGEEGLIPVALLDGLKGGR